LNRRLIFWPALFAPLAISRLCHTGIVWEGEALPMAAAGQALQGKVLYRDVWYDKPPLAPLVHMLSGARPGWALRLEGALFALLCCWLAYRFASHLWSDREGRWAAALMGFFLIFYLPAADIPLAPDLLMLAPHLAAVWLASARRPFWSGVMAGVAFWVNPKGVFVAAACLVWYPAGALSMAVGFAAACAVAVSGLGFSGALPAYWEQVWVWGRHYAADTFVQHPFRNGILRTFNWLGFHAALVCAGGFLIYSEYRRPARTAVLKWTLWIALAFAGTAAGMRFFPRYYFLLLAPLVLMAAREKQFDAIETLGETRGPSGGEMLLPPLDAVCALDRHYVFACCGALLGSFDRSAVLALMKASMGFETDGTGGAPA
jgi:4-amino-4-deoxy-L-arabinose transferase-like glycosyltransferase